MKKLAIFFAIIIIVVCGVSYLYLNYKANYNIGQKFNSKFDTYLNKEIQGTELATIINMAIDNNEKNSVEKDNKGVYIDNKESSINIKIKFTDNDTIYSMEPIYKKGIQSFVNYYGNITFKCTDIQYHNSTKKIKYMLFEQIAT